MNNISYYTHGVRACPLSYHSINLSGHCLHSCACTIFTLNIINNKFIKVIKSISHNLKFFASRASSKCETRYSTRTYSLLNCVDENGT